MSRKFIPTQEQRQNVEAMVGFGIPQTDICLLIRNRETGKPIDKTTLELHFADEIATGATKANAKVASSLFKDATECPDHRARVAASTFWLRMRSGWKDTSVVEHTGKDGGPIKTENAQHIISAALDKIAARLAGNAPGDDPADGSGEDPSADKAG